MIADDLMTLFARDPDLAMGYYQFPFPLKAITPRYADPIKDFCYIITFQGIRASTCAAMWARFETLMGGDATADWSPQAVLALAASPTNPLITTVRLSRRKSRAIHGIATYLTNHTIDMSRPSAELVQDISAAVLGVGQFTVEHFLSRRGKMDIATTGDVFMRRGLAHIKGCPRVRLTKGAADKIVKTCNWGDLATLASLICFQVGAYSSHLKA